jgi:hypothetical protein
MVDPIRRKLLKVGAAAAAVASTPSVLAQQSGNAESGRFYQRGNVRMPASWNQITTWLTTMDELRRAA